MHVIVTRPQGDGDEMAGRIAAMGHRASLAPLLDMRLTGAALDFTGVQGIVATSRNALRALEGTPYLAQAKELPVFVVGPSSAELARDLGLGTVIAGAGGGRQLVPLVTARCEPAGGPLLYLRGDVVAFDMGAALADAGYQVRSTIVYEAVEAPALPDAVTQAIAKGDTAGVIVMSARIAKLFVRRAEEAGVGPEARRLTFLCISQAVADAIGEPRPPVLVAARPTSEEMLALVKELASNWP